MCEGRGCSHVCIYTSGTGKDCSHRTDTCTEDRREPNTWLGISIEQAAHTLEKLNMPTYSCIQYNFQQFRNQCHLVFINMKGLQLWQAVCWREVLQGGNRLTTCVRYSCRTQNWCLRTPGLSPWIWDRAARPGGPLEKIDDSKSNMKKDIWVICHILNPLLTVWFIFWNQTNNI